MTTLALTTCKRIDAFEECIKQYSLHVRVDNIVISDDHSNLNDVACFEEIVRRYYSKPKIRIVLSETKGYAANMNLLLKACSMYKYILYSPDDMWPTEDVDIRTLTSLAKDHGLVQLCLKRVSDFYMSETGVRHHTWNVGAYVAGRLSTWPGLYFGPSIIDLDKLTELGPMREPNAMFDYAIRAAYEGYNVGYVDVDTETFQGPSAFRKNKTRKGINHET